MTDEDLNLLIDEEMRLYRVYVKALSEESRYPQRIATKRAAWVALQSKLDEALSPDKRRELLRARVAEAEQARRKR